MGCFVQWNAGLADLGGLAHLSFNRLPQSIGSDAQLGLGLFLLRQSSALDYKGVMSILSKLILAIFCLYSTDRYTSTLNSICSIQA